MELGYAARPVPSIQLVGIDGFALNARNRISEREEREVGLLGIWALFALAVTIVAARAYSSARRALAAKLAHEFAYILDAIDQLSAAGDDIVILNASQLPQRGSLLPVAPATPTATWPLLLGSRRAAIVTSFLQAAHALDGMDKRGPELLPGDSDRLNIAFGGGAQLVTTLGDQALLSLRDILSHRRGRDQTTRA